MPSAAGSQTNHDPNAGKPVANHPGYIWTDHGTIVRDSSAVEEDYKGDFVAQTQKKADDFRSNLPNYIDDQVNSATNATKEDLAANILAAKTNANSRGLLYSGTNEQNQKNVKAYESSKLGGQIQNINNSANGLADSYDQNALSAKAGYQTQQIQDAKDAATQRQAAYEQALKSQQSQNQFYTDLFSGIAQVAIYAMM